MGKKAMERQSIETARRSNRQIDRLDSQQRDELEAFCRANYHTVRKLPDGTLVALHRLMFTLAIFVDLNQWGYEKRYCFKDFDLARSEFEKLQSVDDVPTGFIARRD